MTAIENATLRGALCLIGLGLLTGCTSTDMASSVDKPAAPKAAAIITPKKQVYTYTSADRECLKRAMYFESKRSSRDGLMAVGSVVMNRLTSGAYSDSICGVVAQKRQFAPGVMTRRMNDIATPELDEAADAILRGERNPQVKEAMFFHTDGLKFPYDNMHYTTVAGGNAFYEKRDEEGELQTPAPKSPNEYMLAFAPHMASQAGLTAVNDIGASSMMTQTAYVVPQAESQVTPFEATQIPVPAQRPPEATFPPAPQPVSVAMNTPVNAPAMMNAPAMTTSTIVAPATTSPGQSTSTQIYTAAAPETFAIPVAVPVPSQRPQVASIMQVSQPITAVPQQWPALRGNKP